VCEREYAGACVRERGREVCECVCVCVRERERDRQRQREVGVCMLSFRASGQ